MAYSDKWKEKVDKVSQTIDDAVGTNDFSNLSHKVTDLIDSARTSAIEALGGTTKTTALEEQKRKERQHRELVNRVFVPEYSVSFRKMMYYVTMAFGIFWGFAALCVIIAMVIPIPKWSVAISAIFCAIMTALNFFAACRIKKKTGFYSRYNIYREKLENHFYADVPYLAESVHQDPALTVKDLEEMSRDRMFREGHLDAQKKCFIATDELYHQYQLTTLHNAAEDGQNTTAPDSRRPGSRESEEKAAGAKSSGRQDGTQETDEADYSPEVRQMLEEGRDYVNFLQEVNDQIDDETVSAKLDRMTTIVSRIFVELRHKPEKAGKLHPFESYYMPTTKKLLTSYVSLSQQPVQSPKIVKAKKEIEDSLDPINDAFETLLDSLFGDVELDVASEISVMKSMMKQDGLMPDDFEKDKK